MKEMEKYIAWIENKEIIVKEIKNMKFMEFYDIIRTKIHSYGNTVLISRTSVLNKYKRREEEVGG